MCGEETEAVVAVDLCHYWGDLVEGRGGEGVEETFADASHVGGETVDAVCVHSAQVS